MKSNTSVLLPVLRTDWAKVTLLPAARDATVCVSALSGVTVRPSAVVYAAPVVVSAAPSGSPFGPMATAAVAALVTSAVFEEVVVVVPVEPVYVTVATFEYGFWPLVGAADAGMVTVKVICTDWPGATLPNKACT